jgi:hypothetical protein
VVAARGFLQAGRSSVAHNISPVMHEVTHEMLLPLRPRRPTVTTILRQLRFAVWAVGAGSVAELAPGRLRE